MKYEIVNGKLVICGSLAEYGIGPSSEELFRIYIDSNATKRRLAEDEKIREEFDRTGRLPKGLILKC